MPSSLSPNIYYIWDDCTKESEVAKIDRVCIPSVTLLYSFCFSADDVAIITVIHVIFIFAIVVVKFMGFLGFVKRLVSW